MSLAMSILVKIKYANICPHALKSNVGECMAGPKDIYQTASLRIETKRRVIMDDLEHSGAHCDC